MSKDKEETVKASEEKKPRKKVSEFSKEQILSSKQFTHAEKAFLETTLSDKKTYTLAGAKSALQSHLKRKVEK